MDITGTPIPVIRALKNLGRNIREARKRRRIPMELASERAGISRSTLDKIEKGQEGVSMGAYARVLFILGMVDKLIELTDLRFDALGLALEEENLPKRIRIPKRRDE
ncbi:MAG: helix-turn-helix domain-containing protein [Chlamydiae bacterium]|nr:helix-turn-helix domain-containing protein [Chlamydiota bacterium]